MKKVLTAADVIAKGTAGNLSDPDFQEAPKIYSPSIYDDFRSALLTLEKRAKDGKGSLTMTDVQTFDEETRRIVGEMKEYMDDPRGCAERITKMYGGDVLEAKKVQPGDYMEVPKQEPEAAVSAPSPASLVAPAPAAVAQAPPKKAISTVQTGANYAAAFSAAKEEAPIPQTNEIPADDEDIPFDAGGGDGGFGLARGTTNTYAIPGMEEMNPEEYRATLQATISARQAQRRKDSLASSGRIGNAGSQHYLEALSGSATGFPGGGGGGGKKEGGNPKKERWSPKQG